MARSTHTTPLVVVGVNNGVVTTHAGGTSGVGIRLHVVLITPLGQASSIQSAHPVQIDMVLLKAVAKTGKKKDKLFTLCRIDTDKVSSCNELKQLIKKRFCDDVNIGKSLMLVISTVSRVKRLSS